MPAKPKPISAAVLSAWFDPKSLAAGRTDAAAGHVVGASVSVSKQAGHDTVLRARMLGSSAPYGTQLTLSGAALTRAHCTCPIGADGRCKHVAARAICWSMAPDEFAVVGHLRDTLSAKTKAQLIDTIFELLRAAPALEGTLLRPALAPTVNKAVQARGETDGLGNVKLYADKARAAIAAMDYRDVWRSTMSVGRELAGIVRIAEDLERSGNVAGACAVYVGILSGAGRGRKNYETACGCIIRVRKLYRQLGDEAGWAAYLSELQAQGRTLTAFREELKRVRRKLA
jgi:uncharacterized Zn finger protein